VTIQEVVAEAIREVVLSEVAHVGAEIPNTSTQETAPDTEIEPINDTSLTEESVLTLPIIIFRNHHHPENTITTTTENKDCLEEAHPADFKSAVLKLSAR